jgi:hypothetical protein
VEWPSSSPDLNPIEHLWDQLGRAVRARVTNITTFADLRQMLVGRMGCHPTAVCDQAGDQHKVRWCQAVVAVYGSSRRY